MTPEELIDLYRVKLIASYGYKQKLSDSGLDNIMRKVIQSEEQLIEEFIEDLKKIKST